MQELIDPSMELLVCIVNYNEGNQIIELAREKGIEGGTIFYGEGSLKKGVMSFLGLDSVRKEITLMVAPQEKTTEVLEYVSVKKKMHLGNKGIGFRTSLKQVIGIYVNPENDVIEEDEEEKNSMHQGIIIIVNKGEAEDVIDLAQEAGAQGGTVVQARGSGNKEAKKLFNMDIVPEKEMIIVISEKKFVEKIVNKVSEGLKIDEPNKGIIFVIDLKDTRGIQ